MLSNIQAMNAIMVLVRIDETQRFERLKNFDQYQFRLKCPILRISTKESKGVHLAN